MAKYRYQLKNGYFDFDGDAVVELLKSEEMGSIITRLGEYVLARTPQNKGYIGEQKVYKKRIVYNVKADTIHAKRDNLKHNTLLKALGGG